MIIKPVLTADDSECKYSDKNSVYQLIIEGFRGVAALLRRLLFNKLTFLQKPIAFLKDAPIILLDEATASLDVENETLIQTALSRLIKNKTVLVIAHRMRTVAGADKIVVLSDGVVAEQGTPNELYKKNGIYSHMVDLQNNSQSWVI